MYLSATKHIDMLLNARNIFSNVYLRSYEPKGNLRGKSKQNGKWLEEAALLSGYVLMLVNDRMYFNRCMQKVGVGREKEAKPWAHPKLGVETEPLP